MLVEYGMRFSTHHSFYFITLTYRQGKNLQRTATSVRADWREWLLWWNLHYPKGMWVRALELTQKKQPHLHLVVSFGPGMTPRARCERKAKYDARWRGKICDCLEHALSRVWNGIVPDSYVVDCRDAVKGDASYLAKYIAKANQITADLVELGFTRTWSRSRSWPVERFQLLPTVEKSWKKMSHVYPGEWKEMSRNRLTTEDWITWTKENPFLSIGTDLNWEMEKEHEKDRVISRGEKIRKELVAIDSQAKVHSFETGPSWRRPRSGLDANPRWQHAVVGPGRAARNRR